MANKLPPIPKDAIRELLTHWLMEWGSEWVPFGAFGARDWYGEWCDTYLFEEENKGVEWCPRVYRFLEVDLAERRMKINQKGLDFIQGTPELSGVQKEVKK
jgi:hypothetical protein